MMKECGERAFAALPPERKAALKTFFQEIKKKERDT